MRSMLLKSMSSSKILKSMLGHNYNTKSMIKDKGINNSNVVPEPEDD